MANLSETARADIAHILRCGNVGAKVGCLAGLGKWELSREYAALADARDAAQWRNDNQPMRPTTDADRDATLFDLDDMVPADTDEARRLFAEAAEARAALMAMDAKLRDMADEIAADIDDALV